METTRTTQTVLVLAWWPSSEIIHTHVGVLCLLAAATIRGWHLFRWRALDCAATIQGRPLLEGVYPKKYGIHYAPHTHHEAGRKISATELCILCAAWLSYLTHSKYSRANHIHFIIAFIQITSLDRMHAFHKSKFCCWLLLLEYGLGLSKVWADTHMASSYPAYYYVSFHYFTSGCSQKLLLGPLVYSTVLKHDLSLWLSSARFYVNS